MQRTLSLPPYAAEVAGEDEVGTARLTTGITVPWVASGDPAGVPVVLLHAWAESRRAFDRLRAALPPSVYASALDLRGHGDAERPAGGYSLRECADDVIAFLDAVGLTRAVLVGSSSGGYLAQQVAADHPARVTGLVLVGAPRSLRGRPPFADAVDRLRNPVDPGWVRASLDWFPRVQPVPDDHVEDRVADGARVTAHVWQAALRGLYEAVPPTEAAPITAPALVIRGAEDQLLPRSEQEALCAALPHSRLLVYPDRSPGAVGAARPGGGRPGTGVLRQARACSRSASRSSTSSMPTESRTRSPGTSSGEPAALAWVIRCGCSISDSTPPSDSARVNSWVRSHTFRATSSPPRSRNDSIPPNPDICFAAISWCRCWGSPG